MTEFKLMGLIFAFIKLDAPVFTDLLTLSRPWDQKGDGSVVTGWINGQWP